MDKAIDEFMDGLEGKAIPIPLVNLLCYCLYTQ
jgi:hypothetical protein